MNQILTKKVAQASLKSNVPDIRVGHTVKVYQKISEGNKDGGKSKGKDKGKDSNKDRLQIFEGLVIRVNSGHGVDKTFTVRKIVSGVGVEKIFPLHSGTIDKIELIKKAKVSSAKLYHMRDLTGKSARLKERYYSDADVVVMDATAVAKAEAEQEAEVLTVDPNIETESPEPVATEEKAEENVAEVTEEEAESKEEKAE